jgi:hypothetical protein
MSGPARSVFVLEDGQRLVIEPSHTFRNVRVWIPGSTAGLVTIPIQHAEGVALAIKCAAADVVAAVRASGAEG